VGKSEGMREKDATVKMIDKEETVSGEVIIFPHKKNMTLNFY